MHGALVVNQLESEAAALVQADFGQWDPYILVLDAVVIGNLEFSLGELGIPLDSMEEVLDGYHDKPNPSDEAPLRCVVRHIGDCVDSGGILQWGDLNPHFSTGSWCMKDPYTETPGATQPGMRAASLSWPDIEQCLANGMKAILPVGAACKAHGPHLPMDTDYRQAEWLTERLLEQAPVLAWPTLSYGHYPAFVTYPGSISLTADTFRDLSCQVLEDILRAGAQRVLVVNTGLSTIAPLEDAIRGLSSPQRARLANVYRGPRYCAVVASLEEQAHGSHADEIETSIMLVVAPELVDLTKAVSWGKKAFVPGPFDRAEQESPNYSPSGVYGDATLATREKGERVLDAMLDDLKAMLADKRW